MSVSAADALKRLQQRLAVVRVVVFQLDAPGLASLRHAHLAPEHLLEMARAFAEIIDAGGLCCRFSLRFLQKLRSQRLGAAHREPLFDDGLRCGKLHLRIAERLAARVRAPAGRAVPSLDERSRTLLRPAPEPRRDWRPAGARLSDAGLEKKKKAVEMAVPVSMRNIRNTGMEQKNNMRVG